MDSRDSLWLEQLRDPDAPAARRALAKIITLLESTRPDHRERAGLLLDALLQRSGPTTRIGISGVPGVGKSTLIEALGLHAIAQGHRVAVLAVDPSSTVHGGSILGDKTRMERLSVHPRAYIRPSPSAGHLGGVASQTREALLACEGAGYDVILVETVGVGQSEVAVAGMTDLFVLMQLPNAGDELQAIKKGVMELADLIWVNKADVDPVATTRACAQMSGALRLQAGLRGGDAAQVQPISALKGDTLAQAWQGVQDWLAQRRADGRWLARRQRQNRDWMWERIHRGLRLAFEADPAVAQQLPDISRRVLAGELASSTAAARLLALHGVDASRLSPTPSSPAG
ncbi:methylmalonyl Co-A mutase-associated GTPase MeaB [Amphibiibacter pelophylacis]|uniref:Methylmalonyl Co-A mutase-associated GTPase MeaB n=1 Tax=Amphibiibacter pelophylacis TaxID=1799477 RepID=A0ACC6P2X5_9BURK